MSDIRTSLNIPHSAPGATAHCLASLDDRRKRDTNTDYFGGHNDGVRFGMVNGFVTGWRRCRRVVKKKRSRVAFTQELRVLFHELRTRAALPSFSRSEADQRLVAEIQAEIATLRHVVAMAEHELQRVFLGGTDETADGLHPGEVAAIAEAVDSRIADVDAHASAG